MDLSDHSLTAGDLDAQEDDAISVVTDNEAPNDVEELVIAKRETNYVRCLRVAVILILLAAAALCAAAVYVYTTNNEYQDFEVVYQQYAKLIIDTVQVNAQHKLEAVGAIASVVQAHALNSNSTWPFVTVPFFEDHIIATKSLTNAYGVLLVPIVSDKNKVAWEQYSVENRVWINESYEAQLDVYGEFDGSVLDEDQTWFGVLWGESKVYPNNPDYSSGIGVPIFRTTDPNDLNFLAPLIETKPGPYYPQWQAATMSDYYQMSINNDYRQFSDFLESTTIATETGNAVLGMPWTDDYASGYITTIVFPIFDSFRHKTKRNVVAFLSVDIFWQDYISGILPEKAEGIHVVIESSFGDKFTFELVGDNAVYLDWGDLHEKAYDHMAVSTLFGQYLHEPLSNTTYKGAPLYNEFYQYNITVYPSAKLQSQYETSNPVVYMVGVLFVFIFTSLVFVVYDCMVERRQRLVMNSAKRSDAIVSNLFPSAVKKRLYEQKDEEQRKEKVQGSVEDTNVIGVSDPNSTDGPPIAELYPGATVLFADIAGFTAWSSKHTPADVFILLENLYAQFDQRAQQRGVFKVETIGDCYMAVTGLPKPRDDHAVAMAKFSMDMMRLWNEVRIRLLPMLGNDVLEIELRAGMHSGPVTAGVLRSDRARFQLFGDTVNTASRMESNGQPKKIHLSEETAKLLKAAGKEDWLKEREDKIVAKGKGEMRTYWLQPAAERSSSRFDSVCSFPFIDEDLPQVQ